MSATVKVDVGDLLAFHKGHARYGITRGMHLEVIDADSAWRTIRARRPDGVEVVLPTRQVPGFQVFRTQRREFAEGELVRWTTNGRDLGLRNGQGLRLERLSGDRLVLSERDGSLLELARGRALPLDHSYVSTVYSSQGKTCERATISADQTFGRESMYVAVTRAKTGVTIYTEDMPKTMALAEISRAKASAKDVVPTRDLLNAKPDGRTRGRGMRR